MLRLSARSRDRFFRLFSDLTDFMALHFIRVLLLLLFVLWGDISQLEAAGEVPAVDFATEIQPLLARRCYACHGPDQQEGSLRFDDRETLVGEADSGLAPIVPGRPADSELLRRVLASEDSGERMPPEGKALSENEIDVLTRWIESGAEYQEHWAFQPLRRPEVPIVANKHWPQQPLDLFILAKLESAGLEPVPTADPESLIRRVYLDVIGLPPSPEIVAELSQNWSDDIYVALVERLLASPAFGERWARMWLDVVRYAETNSFERDNPKPNAWKYRDYVIDAMNSDKPYSQFMREQIAGDELDKVTAETLTATGYYRLGLWDDEPADPLQAIFDGYDDLVTTTSQGFLGLTLNCARCHDHKIDPLLQKDYYSMVAFMRDVTPYGQRSDQVTNNQVDINPEIAAKHEAIDSQHKRLEKTVHKIEQQAIKQLSAPDQRATEGPKRERVLAEKLPSVLDEAAWQKYSQLKSQLAELEQQRQALPKRQTVLGLGKLDAHPEPTFLLMRGSPHSPGDEVQPTFPKLLGGGVPELPEPTADSTSSGRRRVLADWLASDNNWLTSRVIANRIWLHYFGRGIVRSPNNFGLMGDPPTHPQLLNYLATDLVRNDWHLKTLHRQILLSATYRLGTWDTQRALEQDPSNNLFWRQNVRRLSAEQIRDAVLAVSGQLNERQHGESMYVSLSQEVLASQSRPGQGWGNSSPTEQARRSIYIHVKRSLPVPLLTAFDFPDTDISCEARFLTIQPGQALTMLNSEWMQQQASALLERVEREVGNNLENQAERCLELVTCKSAQAEDVQELVDLVDRLQRQHAVSDRKARHAMCLVALNVNPFFYID